MNTPSTKSLVFTATYNEKENIPLLLEGIWQSSPNSDVLVIDDNSPDGTGRLLDQLAEKTTKLRVIHRAGKLGVGSAHREAIKFAREKNYDFLITMDADFSHDPMMISSLLDKLQTHDFVIGSRFAPGGKLDYHGFRRFISVGANLLARYALGITCRETTTSFRGFNKSLLSRLPIDRVQAEGYSFFLECTYFICHTTKKVCEVPIYFQDRRFGQSKISQAEIYKGFMTLFRLFANRILGRVKLEP